MPVQYIEIYVSFKGKAYTLAFVKYSVEFLFEPSNSKQCACVRRLITFRSHAVCNKVFVLVNNTNILGHRCQNQGTRAKSGP